MPIPDSPPPDPTTLPLPPEVDPWLLEVSDLKQYTYCPRVVYFRYRLPDFRPTTYKMEAGEQAHQTLLKRWRHRPPRGLPPGTYHWETYLRDDQRRLVGRLDLLIETDNQLFVVDFKNARRSRPNWKDQLAAYALLAESVYAKPVSKGFLYLIPLRRAEEVALTHRRKSKVEALITQILTEIQHEHLPPPTSQRGRCLDCEYRRFCNDLF